MVYVFLEGRHSWLYYLQLKMTHLDWAQAPLVRCTEKAAMPTSLCNGGFNGGPRLLPHFCFTRDGDDQNQTSTLLCVSCRSGRKEWFWTLTENPERCITCTMGSLSSQLALILSLSRAETTQAFDMLNCFEEGCS